jgi:hypothetical protein
MTLLPRNEETSLLVDLFYLVCFVFWLNQTDRINQINQINKTNQTDQVRSGLRGTSVRLVVGGHLTAQG